MLSPAFLYQRISAVDHKLCACGVGGRFARKEEVCPAQLLGLAHALLRRGVNLRTLSTFSLPSPVSS